MEFSTMRSLFRHSFVALSVWVALCHGQERWDAVSLKTLGLIGVHLYGFSAYYGYTTSFNPTGILAVPGIGTGSDQAYGLQGSLGWQHEGPKTTASVVYNGSYSGQLRYTNLNSFGHSVLVGLNRQLNTKWTVYVSATLDYSTLAQYTFQPTSLSVLSQLPATASDLAAAFSVGNFSNSQAATMLTGGPGSVSPLARSLLLADRMISYGGQASLTYAPTSRLSFSFSSVTAGGQHALDKGASYVLPRTIGATGGVAVSYALSPRTNIGADVGESRSNNQFQSAWATNASGFLGRMMGKHWFLTLNGGMSYIKVTSHAYGTPPSRQAIGGVALGY